MLLRALNVAHSFGDQTLFQNVNLTLSAGERLALIGENGSGKSTLLKLLAGYDSPESGSITRVGRVSLLVQQALTNDTSALDAVTPPELLQARMAFLAASEQLDEGSDLALEHFTRAEEKYRHLGGYTFETQAAQVLAGLGLHSEQQTTRLSGGQLRRVMLARLLLSSADIYLLDEPTNHLDLDGTTWLEEWIRQSKAAFILASHDRAFLDAVATHTAELERGNLTIYPGAYSQAMSTKATLLAAKERDYAAYQRKRAALKEEGARLKSTGRSANTFNHRRAGNVPLIAAKNKAESVSNTLAGRAKALERRLEQLDTQAVSKPYQDRRLIQLDIAPAPPGPNEVLSVRDLQVERDGQVILTDINVHVRRKDRIAITGPNGSGKSTLLGALLAQIPSTGKVGWGSGLTFFVLNQHEAPAFSDTMQTQTIGEALTQTNPKLTIHQLHEIAAQVQLPGPHFRTIDLSGGQKTRLSFAQLSITQAQVLILDEPTNHLDIRMIEALEELLCDYPGTILFASHDRRLIERVATRTWVISKKQLEEI